VHSDKWAPVAAMLAAVCLLAPGPVASFLTATGLGVLLDPWISLPLYVATAGVTIWTLAIDRRFHRSHLPSRMAWAAAVLVPVGHWTLVVVGWVGVILMAAGAIRNQVLVGRLTGRAARAREASRRLG